MVITESTDILAFSELRQNLGYYPPKCYSQIEDTMLLVFQDSTVGRFTVLPELFFEEPKFRCTPGHLSEECKLRSIENSLLY
jgi:hypothetical protein